MKYYKNLDLADIKYLCPMDLIEKTELWKDIADFIDIYQVSNLGRIKSLSRPRSTGNGWHMLPTRILRQTKDRDKYLLCGLQKSGLKVKGKVHRLVAIAFNPNPDNLPDVNHVGLYEDGRQGNKEDNRYFSLKWSTKADNMEHAAQHGLTSIGEKNGHSKLAEKDVLEIRASNLTHKELAVIYNVGRTAITKIIGRKRWKHL